VKSNGIRLYERNMNRMKDFMLSNFCAISSVTATIFFLSCKWKNCFQDVTFEFYDHTRRNRKKGHRFSSL